MKEAPVAGTIWLKNEKSAKAKRILAGSFLQSPAAGYITGAKRLIDRGFSA
jgi:hypothetical protein